MASNVTRVVAARVPNEIADWLKGKDVRLLIEGVVEQIKVGNVEFGEKGIKVNSVKPPLIEDIRNVVEMSGEDSEEFFRVLYDKLNNYEIEFEDGEIVVH